MCNNCCLRCISCGNVADTCVQRTVEHGGAPPTCVASTVWAAGKCKFNASPDIHSHASNVPALCHRRTCDAGDAAATYLLCSERACHAPCRQVVVRFGASEARRRQDTCAAGTVAAELFSDPNQPQEMQNLKFNSATAPDTQEP